MMSNAMSWSVGPRGHRTRQCKCSWQEHIKSIIPSSSQMINPLGSVRRKTDKTKVSASKPRFMMYTPCTYQQAVEHNGGWCCPRWVQSSDHVVGEFMHTIWWCSIMICMSMRRITRVMRNLRKIEVLIHNATASNWCSWHLQMAGSRGKASKKLEAQAFERSS